jgi:putative peptidoglycan lipid II flippase
VTVGLGIVNLDALINSTFGALVHGIHGQGPRAIQFAFLIYMLPQGVFSVAVSTVLFPTLSRQAARRDARGMRRALAIGMRQINLLLIPAAAFLMVLATPVVRLIYQRGQFSSSSTHYTSIALFWFAVSLPFGGLNLLLTRTFFALKRPWIPTRLAAMFAANAVMTALQLRRLRSGFNGQLEGRQTTMITARIAVASVLLAGASWIVWYALDRLLGRSFPAQLVSVGAAAAVGGAIYMLAVLRMGIPEARQVRRLVLARFGHREATS